MINSKTITILQSLNTKERRGFAEFIESPYHNQREDLVRCSQFLVAQLEKKRNVESREKLFGHVYPGELFNDTKCRLVLSDLFKLLELFLIQEEMQNEASYKRIKLIQAYRKLKQDKLFEKSSERFLEELEKNPYRNAEYYNDLYSVEFEQYQFYSSRNRNAELKLQKLTNDLDVAYFTKKLRQSCFNLAHQSFTNIQYEIPLIQEIIQYIKQSNLVEIPAIHIYFYSLLCYLEPDEESHFHQLKSALDVHHHLFPLEERKELYQSAINYCIRKMNLRKEEYATFAYEFYKKGLSEKFLLENNQLSQFTYRNIAQNAFRLKDFAWAEDFIEGYKVYLSKNIREDVYAFIKARLHFHKFEYDKALYYYSTVHFSDVLMQLAVKGDQIKIYYEIKSMDLLESHLSAMDVFISRKSDLGFHKDAYKNLVKYTTRLINLPPKDSKQKLISDIQNEQKLVDKAWLLEKLGA